MKSRVACGSLPPGISRLVEELTYDYNLYDGDLDDPSPCSCAVGTTAAAVCTQRKSWRGVRRLSDAAA